MWKDFLNNNRWFWICSFIYFSTGALLIGIFPKGDLELLINKYHQPYLDLFMLGFTYLGDGLSLFAILIYLIFQNIYRGLVGILSLLLSTALTHFFKIVVFSDHDRPIRFFKNLEEIYFVKNLEIHAHNSFPSGHTSAAFCVFSFLAFSSKNKYLGIYLWLLAFLVSLSRIYLMQHFFEDTYFGAFLGILCASTVFILFETKTAFKNKFSNALWKKKL